MKDDLSNLLKTWDPAVPEPVAFKRGVWRRIETGADDISFAPVTWWKEFLAALARPRMAAATVAVALLAGSWIGHSAASPEGRLAYLRSVNPYAHVSVPTDS